VRILWDLEVANLFPDVALSIVATDIDETVLAVPGMDASRRQACMNCPRNLSTRRSTG